MKTVYVAEDGKQFNNKKDCEIYERTLGKRIVKDYSEVVNILTNENQVVDIVDLDDLYDFAKKVVSEYEVENGKIQNIFVTEKGYSIYNNDNLVEHIFHAYYRTVIRKYKGFENADDRKIDEVYAHAFNKYHSAGLQEVIDEFDTLACLISSFI